MLSSKLAFLLLGSPSTLLSPRCSKSNIIVVEAVSANNRVRFSSAQVQPASNLVNLNFVSRVFVPYGPDLVGDQPSRPDGGVFNGWGFGMFATEEIAYDNVQQYFYTATPQGYISIIDYSDATTPVVTPYTLDVSKTEHEINDIAVCAEQGWLFVAIQGENRNEGVVQQYATMQRHSSSLSSSSSPRLLQTIPMDSFPSQVLPNHNCTIVAVSNENVDDLTSSSVRLIRNLGNEQEPTISVIELDAKNEAWNDNYVLAQGLHMPLTQRALQYWDSIHPDFSEQLNWSAARAQYKSAIFVEGKSLAWSLLDEELLVNLQVNNGLVRIDVANNAAVALSGYGLKDHSTIPIDLDSKDGTCNLKTYANLFSMRNPDGIATIRYNDKEYVLTANEGDAKEYEGWEDLFQAKDLFQNTTFGMAGMQVHKSVFDPDQALGGAVTSPFNAACEGEDWCVNDVELVMGSTAVNYELDPTQPTFHRMVLAGGRGWTIYELPEERDALLKLVFDSGDDVERTSCEVFPWAYNSLADEDMAPGPNAPNNTLYQTGTEKQRGKILAFTDPEVKGCQDQGDGTPGACPMNKLVDNQSGKRGPQVEHIVSGVACGRLVAVATTEKNSLAYLYDITNIAAPELKKVFHLSPASETKSPQVAYNDGTIGDIDPESFLFLTPEESPTGKAAIMFAGAFSGTVSTWEFECVDYNSIQDPQEQSRSAASGSVTMWSVVRGIMMVGIALSAL